MAGQNVLFSDFAARCADKADASRPLILRCRVGSRSRDAADAETATLETGWRADDIEDALELLAENIGSSTGYVDARLQGQSTYVARLVVPPSLAADSPKSNDIAQQRMAGALVEGMRVLVASNERLALANDRLTQKALESGGVAAMAVAQLQLVEQQGDAAYFREVAQVVAPMLPAVATRLLGGGPKTPLSPGETWDKGVAFLLSLATKHPDLLTPERRAQLAMVAAKLGKPEPNL